PQVGRVAPDSSGPLQRWPVLGRIVRLALEVRLFAAELVPERRRGRGPGPASVFPLRFGGESELPLLRQVTRRTSLLGQLPPAPLRLREVDRVNREVVTLARGELARDLADHPFPLTLRPLVLPDPEPLADCHLDLIFTGTSLGFAGRAAHGELAGRAPAEL